MEWQKGRRSAFLWRSRKKVWKDGEERSLVNIKLETGRHHQIRVQMAGSRMPDLGDAKYNEKQSNGRRKIALCASHLEFLHPKTKEKMIFEIEPEGEGFEKYFSEKSVFYGVDKQQDFS